MKRRIALTAAVLAFASAGCVAVRTWWIRRAPSIPSVGGRSLQIRLPDAGFTYLQKDPRWAADPLGATSCTLGSHGCTVSSVAMACTNLGVSITPGELNELLKKHDGYLPQGWLVWNAIPRVTRGKLTAEYHAKPTHEAIDRALEAGAFPIVKYFLLGGIQHWLVITGKDGTDYLARDPLHDDRMPRRLSTLTERIYALRVVKRAQ